MTPTRRRRLIVISLIVAAVAVAATLTLFALQQNMTYLFSPSEVEEGHAPKDARFRLGGVVEEKSIQRASDSLKVDFVVTDRFRTIPVEYTGPTTEIGFNAQYLVDFIKASGAGEVKLEFKDPQSAGQMRPAESEDYKYRYIVMPMRI